MREYILSVLFAAVFSYLITVASPETGNLSKFVAYVGTLAVAVCILSPFSGDLPDIPEITEYFSENSVSNDEITAEYTARCAVRLLSAETGIGEKDITAEVTTDAGKAVSVKLYVNGRVNEEEIKKHLEDILGCEIQIHGE